MKTGELDLTSRNNTAKLNILMIGPDRSVHGGISAVVNNLYDAGLDKMVNLTYIGTMKDGSRFRKLLVAIKAYLQFLPRSETLRSCAYPFFFRRQLLA